jgi:hypothetical protein
MRPELRYPQIDKELAAWRPTGQPQDLDHKIVLEKERQTLNGHHPKTHDRLDPE